jgi:4-hydroxythreonine-4-phosphate dehydrogenase
MKKIIAIIAGEPNSISSEVIFKSFQLKNKFRHFPYVIIGSLRLLEIQKKKLKFNFKLKEVSDKFSRQDLIGNKLPIINVNFNQKKPFQQITNLSNKYIHKCFDKAIYLVRKKKILGIINCPIFKETLLKKKFNGITEYLAKKIKIKNEIVMLIYNNSFSVSPLTTHIALSNVSKNIKKRTIINKVKIINNFYSKKLKKKPKIGILGLNPHNYSGQKTSEEKKIIIPAIKSLKKARLNVVGPISTDTSFLVRKKMKLNVLVGMYHDQVLTTFKSIYGYNSINLTLGLPFFRVSPDHGVASDIAGMNKANPQSLIESIKFFNHFK